ncbi:hypothetical protein SLI_2828 [Streptomyces lividans 1326]|uniref:Uncharacterized protein n=1 Tax=Streptomyces lividans 1326 TaxID=1200984 RepID=A0A7U9DUV5_STRLI|nr:hypothetical protein SLI_2828 [Streptomyces lividans 1326]
MGRTGRFPVIRLGHPTTVPGVGRCPLPGPSESADSLLLLSGQEFTPLHVSQKAAPPHGCRLFSWSGAAADR